MRISSTTAFPIPTLGRKVQLSYTATDVEMRYNYDIIAHHTHDRHNYPYTTVTEHLCHKHRAVMEWSPERLIQQAAAIYEDVEHYIRRILEKTRYQDQANKMCPGILNFARKAGTEHLAREFRQADSYGSTALGRYRIYFRISPRRQTCPKNLPICPNTRTSGARNITNSLNQIKLRSDLRETAPDAPVRHARRFKTSLENTFKEKMTQVSSHHTWFTENGITVRIGP